MGHLPGHGFGRGGHHHGRGGRGGRGGHGGCGSGPKGIPPFIMMFIQNMVTSLEAQNGSDSNIQIAQMILPFFGKIKAKSPELAEMTEKFLKANLGEEVVAAAAAEDTKEGDGCNRNFNWEHFSKKRAVIMSHTQTVSLLAGLVEIAQVKV